MTSIADQSSVSDGSSQLDNEYGETFKEAEKCRKRKRQPHLWRSNKRQCFRQSGKDYISLRGKQVVAKNFQTLKDGCIFRLSEKFATADRQAIHDDFWVLSDLQKRHYFARTTESHKKERSRLGRKTRTNVTKKKEYSYSYVFQKDGKPSAYVNRFTWQHSTFRRSVSQTFTWQNGQRNARWK